jgi:predicted nucleic acid-binding protein
MGRVRLVKFTIIDTDILVDVGRGVTQAIDCLKQVSQHSRLAASVVTQMELLVGCRNKAELIKVERFLHHFLVIKITDQISDAALELLRQYRLSHGLLIPDALIAATALTLDAPLISKNQRDYRFITNLNLLPYP